MTLLPGDEDELELEDLTDGQDEEDEGDEGPGNDGGQEGDEEQDADEPEEEPQVQGRQDRVDSNLPSRQRRSQTRWQRREAELAAARQRAEAAEQRANALAAERQREEAQRLAAARQQREQLRETMTPEERTAADVQELRGQIVFQSQMDQFWRADASDKASYDAKCSINKTYKRYRDKVETELKKARDSGTNLSREQILRYLVGDEVLSMAERSSKPQAQRRKPVSKPMNSRGDGASTPGKRGPTSDREALRKRLENIPL